MNNRELARIFAAIGAKHGYDSIKAEFAAFNDFKVKWTRSFKWAEFEVSDYLMDAPEDVVWALADTIFKKIGGEDAVYPDLLCGWLTSDDFVNRKQPLYIERFTGLSLTPRGATKDIAESRRRLQQQGLIRNDPCIYAGWVNAGKSRCIGKASILMKVVAMSSIVDVRLLRVLADSPCGDGIRPGRQAQRDSLRRPSVQIPGAQGAGIGDEEAEHPHLRRTRCPPYANTPFHRPAMTPASRR